MFLSLWCTPWSWISASGVLQVRPPSVERLTSMALGEPSTSDGPVVARPIRCAVPSGAKSTHGSVTRSKSPLLPGARAAAARHRMQLRLPVRAAVEAHGADQGARTAVAPAVLLPGGEPVRSVAPVDGEPRLDLGVDERCARGRAAGATGGHRAQVAHLAVGRCHWRPVASPPNRHHSLARQRRPSATLRTHTPSNARRPSSCPTAARRHARRQNCLPTRSEPHPFTHTTCFSVCTTSTRSRCACHHRVDVLVGRGRLVDHVLVLAALDAFGRGAVVGQREAALGLAAAHHAAGAVRAALEALRVALAAHDVAARAHAAGDDAQLARPSRSPRPCA